LLRPGNLQTDSRKKDSVEMLDALIDEAKKADGDIAQIERIGRSTP
jgi:hypothetical protein